MIGVLCLAVPIAVDLDDYTVRALYRPQSIVFQGNSPYGSLVVTRTGDQYNFVENGTVWFTTHNLEEVEETVHYAMAQRPDSAPRAPDVRWRLGLGPRGAQVLGPRRLR